MIPPLVITRQQLDQVIEALGESLDTVQNILEDLLED